MEGGGHCVRTGSRLDNPFEKKHDFSSFFAGPGPRPGARAPGPGLRRRMKDLKKRLEQILKNAGFGTFGAGYPSRESMLHYQDLVSGV